MLIPPVPTTAQVRDALLKLRNPQLEKLAQLSSVPLGTIWKIRGGLSKNAGIDTVHKFQPFVDALAAQAAEAAVAAASAPKPARRLRPVKKADARAPAASEAP
jgi:hypothetical protein